MRAVADVMSMSADPTDERTHQRDRRPTAEQPREDRGAPTTDEDRVMFLSWDAALVPPNS